MLWNWIIFCLGKNSWCIGAVSDTCVWYSCRFLHIHLPKLEIKLVYNKHLCIQLLRATTLLKILLKKKICVMSSFYLKFWVLLKVTMRDPLRASRDGTDTQFLNPNGEIWRVTSTRIWRVTSTRHSWVGRHGTHLSTTPAKRVGYESTNAKAITWPAVNPTKEGSTNPHPLLRLPVAAEWETKHNGAHAILMH